MKRTTLFLAVTLAACLSVIGTGAEAQDAAYRMYFTSIQSEGIEVLEGEQVRFDFNAAWAVYEQDEAGEWHEVDAARLAEQDFKLYVTNPQRDEREYNVRALLYGAEQRGALEGTWVMQVTGSCAVDGHVVDLDSGEANFSFVKEGVAFIDQQAHEGSTLGMVLGLLIPNKWSGKIDKDAQPPTDGEGFRAQLKNNIFMAKKAADNSGLGGQASFWIIRACIILSLIPLVFSAIHLRMGRIFPFKLPLPQHLMFLFWREVRYNKGIDPRFDKEDDASTFIAKWAALCKSYHERLQKALNPDNGGGEDDPSMIARKNWYGEDGGEVQFLKLQKELVAFNENGKTQNPTLKIMEAGLKNQINNGMTWFDASEEVDRAMESRASGEINRLKRVTFVEWLWYLATIAPLAGLLGTVTGISLAFLKLGESMKTGGATDVVGSLAPSINEALWTTILGLLVAMIMMGFHAYFTQKIDWISSKWSELFLKVSEDL